MMINRLKKEKGRTMFEFLTKMQKPSSSFITKSFFDGVYLIRIQKATPRMFQFQTQKNLFFYNKKQMRNNSFVSAFIIMLLVCSVWSIFPPSPLCTDKLYSSLKNFTGRLSGTQMQVDLYNTLQFTNVDQADLVLQRMALYSTSINPFLSLINQSYIIQTAYTQIDDQQKLNFDYLQYCTEDICQPEGTLSFGNTAGAAAPKPGSITTQTVCYVPDNLLCSDFIPSTDAQQDFMIRSLGDKVAIIDEHRRLVVYWKNNFGNIDYCATYDPQTQMVVHVCEKYRQWVIQKYRLTHNLFSPETLDQLTKSNPDQQYMINYILAKQKFGERLGKIYNDCHRFGPLHIPE